MRQTGVLARNEHKFLLVYLHAPEHEVRPFFLYEKPFPSWTCAVPCHSWCLPTLVRACRSFH